MVNEFIQKREMQDEEKLMNAIHKNYQDTRMNRLIDRQLKELEQKERENAQKKMMWAIFLTGVCSLILEIIILVMEA